jgi:hypothetical protein
MGKKKFRTSKLRKGSSAKIEKKKILLNKGKKRNSKSQPSDFSFNKAPKQKYTTVRVMGQGQFRVNHRTANRINDIDNSIVETIKRIIADEKEFKKKLRHMLSLVLKEGQELSNTEIIKSDMILPSNDISVEEAKNVFKGQGVVPEGTIV